MAGPTTRREGPRSGKTGVDTGGSAARIAVETGTGTECLLWSERAGSGQIQTRDSVIGEVAGGVIAGV